MIAAIYARKSTDQFDADAEHKSVPNQIAGARAFAQAKGWTINESHVYADDAVSGAETRKLVKRQRLLDLVESGRPPFQVLLMRDASRFSRRDGDEAFGELKRIAQTGLAIWFYQDARQFAHGDFASNTYGFLTAEMNAEYRRQIAKYTKEAHLRKAKAGHVTGGRCFGYDNICSVCDRVIPVGKTRCCREGHTEKRINETHAAVIRRIFTLCADGNGYSRIAHTLNEDRAATPVGRRGRPAAWSSSSVYEVLHRPLYRGEDVYNKTRRRGPDGATTFAARPESEWMRFDRPDLRIVSDAEWEGAHARIASTRERLDLATGRRFRRRDGDAPYLLSGLSRCAVCGGSVGVLDRRAYGCLAHRKNGDTVCRNAVRVRVDQLETAVLRSLHRDVLRPAVVTATIDGVLAELAQPTSRAVADLDRRRQELATLDFEIANYTAAIGKGAGDLPTVLDALKTRQTRRERLMAELTAHAAVDLSGLDRRTVARLVRERLTDWRTRLAGNLPVTRELLREILPEPLMLTPKADGGYRFDGAASLGKLLGEISPAVLIWRARQDSGKVPAVPFSGLAA